MEISLDKSRSWVQQFMRYIAKNEFCNIKQKPLLTRKPKLVFHHTFPNSITSNPKCSWQTTLSFSYPAFQDIRTVIIIIVILSKHKRIAKVLIVTKIRKWFAPRSKTHLDWKRWSGWLESRKGLLFVTEVSKTCTEAFFRINCYHLTLKMASARTGC